jgi:hypothetical protein
MSIHIGLLQVCTGRLQIHIAVMSPFISLLQIRISRLRIRITLMSIDMPPMSIDITPTQSHSHSTSAFMKPSVAGASAPSTGARVGNSDSTPVPIVSQASAGRRQAPRLRFAR